MIFFDSAYLIFAIPGLIIGVIAQIFLSYAYGKFSKIKSGSNLTGKEVAEVLNRGEGFNVSFKTTPGKLNDYYDPRNHLVNLSEDNARNTSIANVAVVAHEFGHVQQKASGSFLFKFRSALVPAVNIGSNLGIILIMVGVVISLSSLSLLGLLLFSLTTVFTLITLPLEIDASRRGMNFIKKYNLIDLSKLGGARAVLSAAALTYVAALVSSIGQLIYFYLQVQGSSRD